MSTIKPGDVMLTKSCRMVRVLASRDDGAVAMRDYRSRVAVRSVDTDRLSYHSEHELTLVQPPATPQEPEPYGPFFDPCGKCVTRTHCAHHDRCLAECVPADLRASTPSPEGQTWHDIPQRLHDSEINARIEWFFDTCWTVTLGDTLNGFTVTFSMDSYEGALRELDKVAREHYPDSVYALSPLPSPPTPEGGAK